MRWIPQFRLPTGRSYGLSGLIGLLTYVIYGSLNDAWANPTLVAIALYMYLSIPWYSKVSNRVETGTGELTGLVTVGRISRYLLQLCFNVVLLWAFLAGRVLDPAGLEGIGGFFGAAAWVTVLSQSGQYLANWLARKGMGDADRNVVLAISISAIVNALAVSGVAWIQPMYVIVSLCLGVGMFGAGAMSDTRSIRRKALRTTVEYQDGGGVGLEISRGVLQK